MARHHRHSPSSLELYEACPCFEKQEFKNTDAADEGEMMHRVLETGDRRLLETAEQAEQIDKCFQLRDELRSLCGPDPLEYPERRLFVRDNGELLTSGTADLVLMTRDRKLGVVLDWKMGVVPVSPADTNLQIQCYIAGLFLTCSKLEQVLGVLAVPRQDSFSRHLYDRDDLVWILDRIREAIHRREDPFREPTCDESACGLCGLRGRCPALLGTAVATFRGTGTLPLPSEFEPGRLATPLDRARAQVLAKILEQWAADVKRYNTSAVFEHGEPEPPGFALRRRTGGYGADSKLLPEIMSHLAETYGLDAADPRLLQCFRLSVSQLGDYLVDRTGGSKKDILQALAEALPDAIAPQPEVVYLQKKSKKITDEQILLGHITQ